MASYPGAVKTFTTKNAGDTIQPSDVNDVQNEINAIEDGILNGTAPLNSSHSTVVSLSVSGGSTFAGNVSVGGNAQITGNCTIAGSLTVNALTFSTVVTADAQPRCKAVKTSTQSITNATWTALTFDANDFNVGSIHSTSSNPSRITTTSTGVWLFGATVASTVQSQSAFLSFRKNGNTFVGTRVKMASNSSGTDLFHTTTIEQMTSTADYMECMVFQISGGPLEFGTVSSSRVDQPDFYAVKLW